MAKIPGEFVPLNVRYRRDRSIRRAGVMAELLYIRSLALVKRDETNGVVEDYDLDELAEGIDDPELAVAALVDQQLWTTQTSHSWLIRSWQRWNPSEESAAEGKYGNHVRWHEKRGVVSPDCPHCIAPRFAPDIAPESEPESQVREEESREEKIFSSKVADATVRPDVIEILDYFDDRLRANDPEVKLPTRSKKNRDAARLLLDRDGRTVDQVKACIDFATADEFWRVNVLSMSKLREKYDQLRAKAQQRSNVRQLPTAPVSPADQYAADRMVGWAWDANDIPDEIYADGDRRAKWINDAREARRQELLAEYEARHA